MQAEIENLFMRREALLKGTEAEKAHALDLLAQGIDLLSKGQLRAAEPSGGDWKTNEWVKKMILIYFQLRPSALYPTGYASDDGRQAMAYDKIALKTSGWTEKDFAVAGFRLVPGAIVREGAFIGTSVVLMPSFVNIGAYVGAGTMVDTWATIGSCAQIGAKCHISGGAGIGGVLEPLNKRPVIIEDNVFVGARSEIAEGVIVRKGAVISMGVFIGASTPIVDRSTGEVTYGEVPPNSVVLPGSRPVMMGNGDTVNMPCALIVKSADEKTREKVQLNELVRN